MSGRGKSKACLRFNVNKETGCWEWAAATNTVSGYGLLVVDGKHMLAHRYSYEQFYGRIPDGLTIDHLCCNRCCVNPAHLEAVTALENIRRGIERTDWPHKPKIDAQKFANIVAMKESGESLAEIGRKMNLSRERIRRICIQAMELNERGASYEDLFNRKMFTKDQQQAIVERRVRGESFSSIARGMGASDRTVRRIVYGDDYTGNGKPSGITGSTTLTW